MITNEDLKLTEKELRELNDWVALTTKDAVAIQGIEVTVTVTISNYGDRVTATCCGRDLILRPGRRGGQAFKTAS